MTENKINLNQLNTIKEKRWFQHKNFQIAKIETIDYVELENDLILCLLNFIFEKGQNCLYIVFLDKTNNEPRLASDEVDAFNCLLQKLSLHSQINCFKGFIKYQSFANGKQTPAQFLSFSQGSTNSLFQSVDSQKLFKLYRRVEAGENPEEKLLTQFQNPKIVPQITGSLHWLYEDKKIVFGLEQVFSANSGSMWDWTLENLKQSIASPQKRQEIKTAFADLGELLAKFHNQIYSLQTNDPQLSVSQVVDSDLCKLVDQTKKLYEENKELLSKKIQESDLEKFLKEAVSQINYFGIKFKQHGDFHLGQILNSTVGYQIIDLEGQPIKSLSERWEANSNLQDVASLLRSIEYAEAITTTNLEAAEANFIKELCTELQNQFKNTYLAHVQFPLPEKLEPALKLQILLKTFQEFDYEKRARPEMLWICQKALEEQLIS